MKQLGGSLLLIGLGLFFLPGVPARAQSDGTSSVKIQDVDGKKNSIPNAGEIDELIKNNNLRALSGSTSRWSLASTLNYNGGSVGTPFSEDRPNIAEQSATTTKADLDGNISAKYNINVKNSVMAGVGIRWIAPFAKNTPKDYDGTRFDVENPFVQYQYLYNWGVQSVLQAQVMQWTQADSTAMGYNTQYNIDQENMYEIGESGVSVGASVWGEYTSFDKSGTFIDPDTNEVSDIKKVQADWQFAFAPELEYQISEKLNFRTAIYLWMFEHYRNMASTTFFHDKVYQSVGVGWSITRDIFLYPNVQFLPDNVASNLTNVGLQATVNLF